MQIRKAKRELSGALCNCMQGAARYLNLLYDTCANAHSNPQAPEQDVRGRQVDCSLRTVYGLGGCPDAGAMVTNQLCRPRRCQQCLLGRPVASTLPVHRAATKTEAQMGLLYVQEP